MSETMIYLNRLKDADKIRQKIFMLKQQIAKFEQELYSLNSYKNDVKKEKIKIIKQCPNKKCNGYLNNDYICTICDTKLCIKCEKIKTNNHICDDVDIDTVLLKKKECNNCPRCAIETFKDGGCSQVWCPPPCNEGKGTAWNFNTGEIETGPTHAPLYYEYMRKQNLNNNIPQNNICINRNYLPNIFHIDTNIWYMKGILKIHRKVNEMKGIYMKKYKPVEIRDQFKINLDLRLKYLQGEIDEKNFKKNLLMRQNKEKKNRKVYENLEMLYNVCYDIFEKLSMIPKKNIQKQNTKEVIQELETIREYYNLNIPKTKKIVGCKSLNVTFLNDKWHFTH